MKGKRSHDRSDASDCPPRVGIDHATVVPADRTGRPAGSVHQRRLERRRHE